MSSISKTNLSLPFEILAEIINHVATKNRALFRLRLCSKQLMHQAISCLEHLRIDGYPNSHPSIFLGSKPQSIFLSVLQDDKNEIEALSELVSTCTRFQLRSYTMLPASLTSLGPRLNCITSLACSYDCSDAFRDFLLAWIPHLSQLEELSIGAHTVSLDAVLESLSQNCTRLKSLVLDANQRMPAPLSKHLKALTSLEKLVIGITYDEVRRLHELVTAKEAPEVSHLEAAIERFRACLPAQLQHDLTKIPISIGSTLGKIPNIFASLYARSASETVADFCLEKLQQSNLSHDCSGWGAVLMHCLIRQPDNRTRLCKLLRSGVDIWTPTIMFKRLGVCNAFHIAAAYSKKAVMEELLSRVDWNAVTDLAPFRTSYGYTPLHLVSEAFDTWKTLYSALQQRFPGVTHDRTNSLQATPLLTLHKRIISFAISPEMPLVASELMLDRDANLLANPQLIDPNCSLFPTVFKFYTMSWRPSERHLKGGALVRRLLEHHCRRLGVSQVTQLDRISLGIKTESISINQSRLHFALLLDEELFSVLSRGFDKASLSECLYSFANRKEPTSWSTLRKLEALLQSGAECTYESRHHRGPLLCSYIGSFLPSHDEGTRAPEAWRIFWSGLWLLVDHGAKFDYTVGMANFVRIRFAPRISLRFSHPLNDLLRISLSAPAAFQVLTEQLSRPVESQFYYDALDRMLRRRSGQLVSATAPSEEYDLEILSRWSPEEGPPKQPLK